MTKLSIENLVFSYRRKMIFQGFNATFDSGIRYILGNNGSGKSTLMKILATVLTKQGGSIFLDDISYEDSGAIRKKISYIPQEFDIYPDIKVCELLKFINSVKQHNKNLAVDEIIEKFRLGDYKNVKMRELSVGTRKRVSIAQAMLNTPSLLICDEPTAGLDTENRKLFNDLLQGINEENPDMIILYSTHLDSDISDFSKIALRLEDKNV